MPTEIYTLLTSAGLEAEALAVLQDYWAVTVLMLYVIGWWFVYLALSELYYSLKYNDHRLRKGFQWRWIGGTLLAYFPGFLQKVLTFIYT